MKLFTIIFLFTFQTMYVSAQPPESFFPTQVGNLWQYYGAVSLWQDWSILQDSVASDGYRYLYVGFPHYPGQERWNYRLDSAFSVYRGAGGWGDTLYRLAADSGDVWSRAGRYYTWVINVYQDIIFGRTATVKVIRSGPIHPDSGGSGFYFTEQHLASGFGVIYHWEEPSDVAFLSGCIVAGDTFGIITSVPSALDQFPEHFAISQNFPNPFNPYTTFEYSIPTETYIRLSVYDILGSEVAVLIDERKLPGNYKVVFDGSNLSSGVYIARMRVDGQILTRKITLIK